MKESADTLMQELLAELQRTYDRVKYYNDCPSKQQLIYKLEQWVRDADEIYNGMESSDTSHLDSEIEDLNDKIAENEHEITVLTNKNEKLESEYSEAVGEKRKRIDLLQHELEQERNDSLLLQSSILAVLGRDKLDLVLGYAKELDSELSQTSPKNGVQ